MFGFKTNFLPDDVRIDFEGTPSLPGQPGYPKYWGGVKLWVGILKAAKFCSKVFPKLEAAANEAHKCMLFGGGQGGGLGDMLLPELLDLLFPPLLLVPLRPIFLIKGGGGNSCCPWRLWFPDPKNHYSFEVQTYIM